MTDKYPFAVKNKACKTKNAYNQCYPLVVKPQDKKIFKIGIFRP